MSSSSPSTVTAVEDRLFGALAVLRLIALLNVVGLTIYRRGTFEHPVAMVSCVAVMAGWTAFATWAYSRAERRTTWLLIADLTLAVGLILITPLVKGADFRATVPSSWIICALLAWAIRYHWRGGLGAGVLLAVADLSQREVIRQTDYNNAFLLVLSGVIVGYLCGSLQAMAVEREAAEHAAAAAAERARLARAVHDGVLQVLALVQRRGRELGGPAEELGELAGQQERELRRLIRTQSSPSSPKGTTDLTAVLADLERPPHVIVSTPGTPVEVPSDTAEELLAAVLACLDNVTRHVGEDSQAWVLVQLHAGSIEISVRDEGPGIPPGREAAAVADGRLGIAESIRGRVESLGGTAVLTTGTFGTEWELTVPTAARQATRTPS